jgi:hypothetical protein
MDAEVPDELLRVSEMYKALGHELLARWSSPHFDRTWRATLRA